MTTGATSIAMHPTECHRLFASAGNAVLEFDLRGKAVMIKEHAGLHTGCEDEINQVGGAGEEGAVRRTHTKTQHSRSRTSHVKQITIHSSGACMASADDAGTISIVDLAESVPVAVLPNLHEPFATAVAFMGDTSEVVSGGYDATIVTSYVVAPYTLLLLVASPAPFVCSSVPHQHRVPL